MLTLSVVSTFLGSAENTSHAYMTYTSFLFSFPPPLSNNTHHLHQLWAHAINFVSPTILFILVEGFSLLLETYNEKYMHDHVLLN